MKIIGHRGAAGLAPENTIESIQAAVKARVKTIEFDIRATKDGAIVLCHDASLKRTHEQDIDIKGATYSELSTLVPRIPTLQEALEASENKQLIIELKGEFSDEEITAFMQMAARHKFSIASFHHLLLRRIHARYPDVPFYVLEHHSPFEIITRARSIKATGIGLNYWLLNPLTYLLAKRYKLSIYVYTVNQPILAWIIRTLYPSAGICTDFPNKIK